MLARIPGLKRVSRRSCVTRTSAGTETAIPIACKREEIPLESRIIFACDAFNAMTSDRPYREAMRPWIAVSELREGAGGQFDPDVVDALVGRPARAAGRRPDASVPAAPSAFARAAGA